METRFIKRKNVPKKPGNGYLVFQEKIYPSFIFLKETLLQILVRRE